MAKRYVLSPIIGTGQSPDPSESRRAAVGDVSLTNHRAVIPTDQTGQSLWRFALCIVGTGNLAGVLAVSNAFVFPDYPLDGRLDGMEAETRTGMIQSAQAYDLDGEGAHLDLSLYGDSHSYRQLLDGLGKQLDPSFSIDTFDVLEYAG